MSGEPRKITPYYQLTQEKVLQQIGSNLEGLDATEASKRTAEYGPNILQRVDKESFLVKLFRQLKDLMIILLLISAAIAFYLDDLRTGSILFTIVLINATIGYWQEHKAENVMASLEKLVVPMAKVKRSAELSEIPTAELVPGDVIYIAEGDSVPADARILSENELSTNDFALTGESNPSRKFVHPINGKVELPLRHNLVFMGTTVATGNAYCVVMSTGMQTELGRIANLSQSTHQDLSPLQKEMNHVATTITKGTIGLGSILLVVSLSAHQSLHDAFIFAIAIASAMIPQGLPAEVNAALASAAGRLARARTLVKKLSAVESLGATSIICTDKTGTLTKNQMTVEQIFVGHDSYWVSGAGYEAKGQILDNKKKVLTFSQLQQLQLFFATGAAASNAKVHQPDDKHVSWYVLGDPTEGALITMAAKAGIDHDQFEKKYPELREFTFDSVRKRMSSIRDYNGYKVFAKGAPESILEVCNHILIDGKVYKLSEDDRQQILARNELLARGAMRNLALAYKPLNPSKVSNLKMEEAEQELIYLGMACMIDPPRDEVPAAMHNAAKAHIPVAVITGDNALTASAIAVRAGLAKEPKELKIVVGDELRQMENSQIIHLLDRGQVIFSRITPEDKLRIVELGKSAHKVVAVTGDGINDAPALKRADIGVAMGVVGTDVAKQSADIVLLDDSFHTLVSAVQEGRIIFQNIKKATLSCLTSNTGELFTVLISLVAVNIWNIPIAISAVLILCVDLIAELFPIAALGWDGPDGELMEDYPRQSNAHILNRHNIYDLALSGVLMGSLAYSSYLFFLLRNNVSPQNLATNSDIYASAITLTYITICLCQFANILSRRNRSFKQSFLSSYMWSNPRLWLAFSISLSCILLITYVPSLQHYLGSGPIRLVDWLFAFMSAIIYLAVRWLCASRLLHHIKI